MAVKKPAQQPTPPVPAELASWLADRLRAIESDMINVSGHDSDDEAAWSLFVLARLANIEALSSEMTRLMTKYVIDRNLARPATVAKLTGVHQSSASSRASSPAARQSWSEIWPAQN